MKILDLFCGCGGAANGLYRAALKNKIYNLEITGVDIEPQKDYPYNFIQRDIETMTEEEANQYDFIWASPPCQLFLKLKFSNKKIKAKDHIEKTRALIADKPSVIENVLGAPVRRDVILHGGMFNLKVYRRRIFEINNFFCFQPEYCDKPKNIVPVYGFGKKGFGIETWRQAMNIHWTRNRKSIAYAVPPAYSEYIFSQFLLNNCGRELLTANRRELTRT